MKYKVGDKVRIKTWEEMEKEYLDIDYAGFTDGMEREIAKYYPKRILTIKEVSETGNCYSMKEMDDYIWLEETMSEILIKPICVKKPVPIKTRFELLDIR